MSPPNLSLLFIMICFWIAFWLVDRYLVRPLTGVIDERQHRIDHAEAEWSGKHEEYLSATSRLEGELEQAAREAAKRREELRGEAEEQRAERLRSAHEEAQKKLNAALTSLESDADAARDTLRNEADRLARLMASRVLGREVPS